MEHKKTLEELNKQSLDKIDDFLKTKAGLKEDDHEKIKEARQKWQSSWSEFMDILMYLETLEI